MGEQTTVKWRYMFYFCLGRGGFRSAFMVIEIVIIGIHTLFQWKEDSLLVELSTVLFLASTLPC